MSTDFNGHDRQMMAHALVLARQGLNTTSPNPRVGCVITDGVATILAQACHQRAGQAHAEIRALDQARSQQHTLQGATVYVTLEPCSHHGRTGPCVEALIAAGVGRVVYAMEDPNPEVCGRGLEILKRAGITVQGPLLEDSARALNPGFIQRMTQGRPYIRCKMAMSLDGRTAMASGESKWITDPHARADVQRWRARSCAIVTGVDSVIHDDPALTVRLGEHDRQPLRVIVDTHGRCPAQADILSQAGDTVIATCAPLQDGRRHWVLPQKQQHVDLSALSDKLAAVGCNEVLVESGARLAGAFVAAGLVDEWVIYMAPKLMGSLARPLFDLPLQQMNSQLALKIKDIRAVGDDWRIIAHPDPEA